MSCSEAMSPANRPMPTTPTTLLVSRGVPCTVELQS